MNGEDKRDFRRRKFRTSRLYKGKKRKRRSIATTTANAGTAGTARPNGDGPSSVANAAQPGGADFISDAIGFVSASEKKLSAFQGEETASNGSGASAVICEVGALTDLVSGAVCATCGKCELVVVEVANRRKGLASVLELKCKNEKCPAGVISSVYSSQRAAATGRGGRDPELSRGSPRDSFAINVKAVLAARAVGIGHDQLHRFCAILGLPKPLHQKTFHNIAKKVHAAATKVVSDNLAEARQVTASQTGQTDIGVMFDGTWQKRGHKSHNGVGTAISLDTGLCLDFEVLSNYCQSCSRHQKLDEQEEEVWQAFHSPVCEKNVNCSSHAMETEAALRIWHRTLSYSLQFTTFLSDGDSSAYTAVCQAGVYGPKAVTKEDCTNHVAKRLGTAMRKLKTPLPRGEKLGDKVIEKLQHYYQIAITSNRGSLRGMYCAIWASFFHSCSSNEANVHKFCPSGDESWCKHKRAEALGEPAPDHTPLLTRAQGKALLPIYKRLTDAQLLTRCLQGKTQNAAESLNSKIWMLCPKTRFASRTVVETATALAVLWFNRGHTSFEQVLQELGIFPSEELVRLGSASDQQRIRQMSAKLTAEARSHRRSLENRARTEDSARKNREGETYAAGAF
ncbi:uncharacterized protein LOC144177720 [Haemaphysalis longicornis]